jgi:hypothetical protein
VDEAALLKTENLIKAVTQANYVHSFRDANKALRWLVALLAALQFRDIQKDGKVYQPKGAWLQNKLHFCRIRRHPTV